MALGITDQVRRAAQKQNRLAAIIGGALGAFVPIATCTLAHREAAFETVAGKIAIVLVLGGLAYSATTVAGWARIAFASWVKAIGFVVLLEGTMTLARSLPLTVAALVILTVINALATACNLATDQKEARKAAKAPAKTGKVIAIKRPSPAAKRVRK
jgi:uncharacterized protein YqgC (DUF456 family)